MTGKRVLVYAILLSEKKISTTVSEDVKYNYIIFMEKYWKHTKDE